MLGDPPLDLTNIIGICSILMSVIAFCIIRSVSSGHVTPQKMYCNAKICWIIGLLKIACGVFEIAYCSSSGGTWWGWILIVIAILWVVRGNRFRRKALRLTATYQPFNDANHPNQQSIANETDQQIVVSINNQSIDASNGTLLSQSIYPGVASPNSLQQPMISSGALTDPTPLIRNAVPPSPFVQSQSYINPYIQSISTSPTNIPMATTITATASGDNDRDGKDDDGDDDQQIPKTPQGPPSRKTSEGNVTFT